jgi:hypothetical protein
MMRPSISVEDLPGDLPSLLNRYAKKIDRIQPINGLFGGAFDIHGATFCVFLADETRVKARYWPKNADLIFQLKVLERFPRVRFPKILIQSGQSTLEDWIEGESIRDTADETVVMESGKLLGCIHQTPPPDSAPGYVHSSIQEYEVNLTDGLDQLKTLEYIDLPFARQVQNAAMEARPNTTEVGLIHRDFCADNLILSNNMVCSIDNTTFAIGPFELDLARTWYRWRMKTEHWNVFLRGYSHHRDSSLFCQHETFWKACVLVRATLMRIRSGLVDRAMIPLSRLHELFL